MLQVEHKPFHPPRLSFTEAERDIIVRQTLNEIEIRLNAMSVNKVYRMAFSVVIKVLRGMKP